MGRVRTAADSTTAKARGTPFFTLCSAKSTTKIEFLTIIPAKAIKPIIEVAVKKEFKIKCPGMIPKRVKGIGP